MSSLVFKSRLRDFAVKQYKTGRSSDISQYSQLLSLRKKRKLKNRVLSKLAKYSRRKNRRYV